MKKNKKNLGLIALGLFVFLLTIVFSNVNSVAAEDVITKNAPVYLSDLKPLPGSTTYIADKDAEGNPLMVPGMKFKKGLSVTANSELSYLIDGKYTNFQVTIGHASSYIEFQGKLIFTVLGDGKVLFKSDAMSAKDSKEINVEVKGVHNITLRVNSDSKSQFVVWGGAILN